ncbi:MAG: TetR/AcrR family transcriptional regulator [Paracoccus sp. (in: a-proteobacteria)]|nr:TetR/AcrR family transcriptional regulator [Paracoccus sp. (in: a-proteobacteria)]
MARDPANTRNRLLRAADEIAATQGAGGVSLDAVAAHAGVSKGGLLYHFPSKSALLRALVEHHLAEYESRLDATSSGRPNAFMLQLIDGFCDEWREDKPVAGLLAALAEDPAILAPVGAFYERAMTRVRAESTDPLLAQLALLALQGLRADRLLGVVAASDKRISLLLDELRARLRAGAERAEHHSPHPGGPA